MESKRKASSSGASCDEVSLCLYLALLAIFPSPSPCIKFYGYDFDKIESTKIYSLDYITNCDNKTRVSETKEEVSLIYAEVQPERKLKFCIYEAVYTVLALKGNIDDDIFFLTEISRLLKSIYPLNRELLGIFGRTKTLLYHTRFWR